MLDKREVERRYSQYLKTYNLQAAGYGGMAKLVQHRAPNLEPDMSYSSFWDHPASFKHKGTGELVATYQPYVHADFEGLGVKPRAYAELYGLAVRISRDESWHYPGSTVLIEYRRVKPEVDVVMERLRSQLTAAGFAADGDNFQHGEVQLYLTNYCAMLSLKGKHKRQYRTLRKIIELVDIALHWAGRE